MPTPDQIIDTCTEALSAITDALCDHFYCYGVGFTCSEAEALYDAYIALGLHERGEVFMRSHAESDDPREGDLHEPFGDTGWRRLIEITAEEVT